MYRRWLLVALMCALLLPQSARANNAFVTAQTYEDIPFELSGQRAFVMPDYEVDVYDAVMTDEQSSIAFDIYPYEPLSAPPAFLIELPGASAEGFVCEASPIENKRGFGYRFTGPGLEAKPTQIRIYCDEFKDSAFTITMREHRFTRMEPAYFFREEVGREGVLKHLREAEDIMLAAADYLPDGARLVDSYVAEDYASIQYRKDDTRIIVDYYEDGHIEKMLRGDEDKRVYFASTARDYVTTIGMNDRRSLEGREEMRPDRKRADAVYRSGGIAFRIEGYRFEEEGLLIDWSASSRREGLLAMIGSFETSVGRVADDYFDPYGSIWPMSDIIRLSGERTAFKGVQGLTFEDEIGMPREPFDVTMTLYVFEPLVPIEPLDGIAPSVRSDAPSLIEDLGIIRYLSELEVRDDGSTEGGETLVQDFVNEHGHDDADYVYALEAFGYLKPVRAMKLSFTVEP